LDHWLSGPRWYQHFRSVRPGDGASTEDVAEQLRDAILDGRFAAGSKLPPERELAEEFRVNRTSIRDAIKVLEGLGLVSVRQGDGATVRPLTDASFDVLAAMIFHGGRVNTDVVVEMAKW
jgi:DNA-binding FadR family transcriptional regulator